MLFKTAAAQEKYAYYHLLSGMDLPLHNQEYIHAFFEKYAGHEFFTFTGEEIYKRENPKSRLQYHYRFQDASGSEKKKNILLKIQNRLLLPIQRRLGIDRLKNNAMTIGYGANWVSVTDDFVRYILEHETEIRQMYQNSFCCDEVYKHTLLINSPFKDNIFDSHLPGSEEYVAFSIQVLPLVTPIFIFSVGFSCLERNFLFKNDFATLGFKLRIILVIAIVKILILRIILSHK